MTTMDDGGENVNDVQTNFIDELYDKFLECRLCSRTLRNPKMLVCQHTFCADCLEVHYEMDEQDRPYRFLLSHNRDLLCPCCRARTPLPTGGIWRLPDNFLVANLTDVIQRRGRAIAAKSGGGGCEICLPVTIVWNEDRSGSVEDSRQHQAAAVVKCVDCDKMMCADCAELHRETKVTASHALFTVGDNHDVGCKIHRNETLRFYCEPCEQCVCVLCALHEHNEHEVSSLADGLERHRATFNALLDECRTRIDVMREQQTMVDSFRSSLTAAEDCIQHAAIDAIAAVRRRERELLEGLRSFVGDDAMQFLGEGDSLGVRLRELESVRETMETMIGRTSVELLMTKKDVHQRLRTALERHQIQTPDRVRVGAVQYVAGAEPFRDLHQPTSHVTKLFRSVVDDDAVDSHVTDRSTSSSSSDSETDSKGSDSEDEGLHPGTVRVVSQLPQVEHVSLVARSQDAASGTEEESGSDENDEEDSGKDDEGEVTTKICICDGVVRRMVIRSQSVCDALPAPPRPSGKKIPDFSRPKPPAVTYVDHGTEMDHIETTDVATATTRLIVSDKETYTGYVYLVHKNVSTDNQGTADKATSTPTDVTAAYRNLSTAGRSAMITRGTNTTTATTIDRASSPLAVPRPPTAPGSTPAALNKLPAYPTNQRSGAAQAMSVEQKSSTSDVVSVTSSQIASVAGRVLADTQKPPGPVNVPLRALPVTSSTVTAQQPVATTTTTTSQKQPSTTSGKLPPPPSTQKPVTSPAVTTATPSPTVTSLPPPVATVASPLHRKLAGSVTSSTAIVMSSATQTHPPTVAVAGTTATSMTTSLTASVQKPMTSPKPVTSPNTVSVTNTTSHSQPVQTADISQSVINGRPQAVSSMSAAAPANVRTSLPVTSSITVPTTAAVTSSPVASTQTSMTSQRHSQPSPGTLPPAVVLPQSISSTAQPVIVTSAPLTTRQITSPVTQVSSAAQQRTPSTAPTPSPTPKTVPQTPPTAVDVTATTHKLMTSAVSQSHTTSKTSPTSVTSLPSQPQTTSPASNTLANSVGSTTAQKLVTSLISPTIQSQSPNAVTTSIASTPQSTVTSPLTTSNNHVATSLVVTTAQISVTSTARSPVQTSVAVTSSASVTTQFRHPTTVTTSNNQVSSASASVHVVATGAQKLMTSNSRQQETVTSPLSEPVASESSAAASQLAAPSNVQTPASPVSRQRSVFRSFSMDNVRTTAPVLRLPPPIMTTSVAAVTQRLNGGSAATNGSAKNNWRPANSNR